MIKVSHEVPLTMLEESRKFNDYDYALVHLFEIYPKYLQFYKDSLEMGREVLLDNSIFELEEAFDEDSFAKWVEVLKPTRYIIPDVLDNSEQTIANLYSWNNKYSELIGSKIGVVQGEDYESLTKCYLEVSRNCDEIAISFNYKYYEEMFPELSTLEAWSLGRRTLFSKWLEDGVIRKDMKHHLLGCSLPQEFSFYKNFDWIYSLDTSNPIVHGLAEVRYKNGELKSKLRIKLVDLIEEDADDRQMKSIKYNINEFKKIVSNKDMEKGKKEDLVSLGSNVTYKDQYDKSQLEPIDRSHRREGYIPMKGVDIWTAFEVSFLLNNNMPVFMVLRITTDANSKYIFESKSLKLYLNSFNNTKFPNKQVAIETVSKDLTELAECNVVVKEVKGFSTKSAMQDAVDLDKIAVNEINTFEYDPKLLRIQNQAGEGTFTSGLLRSNCEITNQPDWGRIYVKYRGPRQLDEESLLRYIISYRMHQEFHEPTCERIYQDLFKVLQPDELTVICQYTRRGGIDINPVRSNMDVSNIVLPKLIQQ